MGCSNYCESLIDKYVEGLATVEEKELLESHMKDCLNCRQEVRELQEIIKAAGSLEQVELPQDFMPNLMEKIREMSYIQTSHEKGPRLLNLIRNIPALLYDSFYHNKRTFAVAVSALLIGIFVFTAYNQGSFNMNYATKSAKEEAATESSYAGQAPMMMKSLGSSNQIERESPQANIADAGINSFTAERTQKIIKNADITIYVEKFDEKVDEVIKTVDELGGYIENSQIQGDNSSTHPRRAYMALRIPQDKLNDALDKFKSLGKVTNQQISGENITDIYYDTEARMRNLEQQEARLLEILSMANNVDEILRIESELNRVRTEIDMLKGQLTAWDKMVEMSLVNVNLIEQEPSKEKVTAVSIQELIQRAKQGFITAVNVSMNMLALLAELIGAFLPVAAVIGILYLIFRKLFNKKNKS